MKKEFNDLFSDGSQQYSQYRPHYPDVLFSFLASISAQRQIAWDCATGSGQSALKLADYFDQVIATDASKQQIDSATAKKNIIYRVATAESSHIETDSVDLITVAQALHWFNQDAFSTEVSRVLKDEGILAAWTYNLLSVQHDIDSVINHLYHNILADFWPEERKLVENGYRTIQLPFSEITAQQFNMTAQWSLSQLAGYLNTWSAVHKYHQKHQTNPVEKIYPKLLNSWGNPEKQRLITWPLGLRLWKK